MKKIIALISVFAMLLSVAGCAGDSGDAASSGGLISQAPASSMTPVDDSGTYFDTDIWEPMVIQNAEDIAAGYENAEACQACLYISLDPIEGKIGYYGTDCGGIRREQLVRKII